MTEARFEVYCEGGPPPWWAYFTCPHGARAQIQVAPDQGQLKMGVWDFKDLGNGRCRISPSILWEGPLPPLGGSDSVMHRCHFGPGDFQFEYIGPVYDGRRVSEPEKFRP
ncbi:MAG: hypothetical protein ACREC5_02810 [Thermoplasmata archaeon]